MSPHERQIILAVLDPFADEAEKWVGYPDEEHLVEGWKDGPESELRVGDLRRAYSLREWIQDFGSDEQGDLE